MRLHDRSKFEIHVFATTHSDTSQFLKVSMKGVDWRKKIRNSVEHFHDTSSMSVNQTASLIRSLGIHILLNWDGYSNEGVRVSGLFPLQSAPIQVAHQEYIGTMGADYIQYLITGYSATPHAHTSLYTKLCDDDNSVLLFNYIYIFIARPRPQKIIYFEKYLIIIRE